MVFKINLYLLLKAQQWLLWFWNFLTVSYVSFGFRSNYKVFLIGVLKQALCLCVFTCLSVDIFTSSNISYLFGIRASIIMRLTSIGCQQSSCVCFEVDLLNFLFTIYSPAPPPHPTSQLAVIKYNKTCISNSRIFYKISDLMDHWDVQEGLQCVFYKKIWSLDELFVIM